jgi:hypothetical protein
MEVLFGNILRESTAVSGEHNYYFPTCIQQPYFVNRYRYYGGPVIYFAQPCVKSEKMSLSCSISSALGVDRCDLPSARVLLCSQEHQLSLLPFMDIATLKGITSSQYSTAPSLHTVHHLQSSPTVSKDKIPTQSH